MKNRKNEKNKSIDSDALNDRRPNYLKNIGALTAILGAGAAGIAFTPQKAKVAKTSIDAKSQVVGSLSRVKNSISSSEQHSDSLTSLSTVTSKTDNFVSSQKQETKEFATNSSGRNVSTAKEFVAAMNNQNVQNIYLTKDINLSDLTSSTKTSKSTTQECLLSGGHNRNLVIHGNRYSINLGSQSIYLQPASNSSIVRNIAFENTTMYSSSQYGTIYATGQGINHVTLNNVKAVGGSIFCSSSHANENTLTLQGATKLNFVKSYSYKGHLFSINKSTDQHSQRAGVSVSSGITIGDRANVVVNNDKAVANDFIITGDGTTNEAFFSVGNDAKLLMNTNSHFNVMINGNHQNTVNVGHRSTVSMKASIDNLQLFDTAKQPTADQQNKVEFAKDSNVKLLTKSGSNIRMYANAVRTSKSLRNIINFNGKIKFIKNSGSRATKGLKNINPTQANIEIESNKVNANNDLSSINFKQGVHATLLARDSMSNIGIRGGSSRHLLVNITNPKIVTLRTNGAPQYLSKPVIEHDSPFDVNANLTDVEVTKRIKIHKKTAAYVLICH
jgi:hypothetical protein